MSAPAIYLTLPGTARSALEFYSSVFGGSSVAHTFASFGRTDGPPDAVAHGELSGAVNLFVSDAGDDEPACTLRGARLALLGTAPPATLHQWFERLSVGGEIVDPLEAKPWGACDGQVADRYGLTWLIGYEPTP